MLTKGGAECSLPFMYLGKKYDSCIGYGYLWCATTLDYDEDGEWDMCELGRSILQYHHIMCLTKIIVLFFYYKFAFIF